MADSHAVPGFLPSRHGLRFPNRFPAGPTLRIGPLDPRWIGIGDASAGLCGGMSWYVRERFGAGLPVPGDVEPPGNGTPLFRALVRRQVLSLDWLRTPLRFWVMARLAPAAAAARSLDREWPRIRATLDAGDLAMVGLVRRSGIDPRQLSQGHQVLAFGYDVEGAVVSLRVADPNWPGRDDVRLTMTRDGGRQSTGEPLVGWLSLP